MSHESHEMRKLQTSTSMYMPQGASPTERTSSDGSAGFASTPGSGSAGGLGTPGSGSAGGLGSPGGRLAQLRPIRKKLTRGETRTSFMDRSLDSKGDRDGAPTKTFRLMSDTNMSALKLFKTLDVDNSGCLDLDEVAKLAELLEVSMPKSGVRRSFEEMDEDGDGEVTFEEFAIWWQNVKENDRRKVRRMVRNAFHKLDRNGDGTIHKHEFKALMNAKMRKVMKLLGGPFDLEKDWALMHRAYVERGGQLDDHLPVSFSLFESWWKNRNGIDDGEVPVIPEAMALRINDAGNMDPILLMRAAKRRKARRERQAAGLPEDPEGSGQGRGAELWEFLRPRLRLLVEQQKKWGDVSDIYDSHTTSYHEEIRLPQCIRDPDSNSAAGWDLIQLVFLIYVSFGVPLRVCFGIDVPVWSLWFWVDNIVDVYFITDLFLQFRTSFRRQDGMMEDDPRAIAEHYLRTWFVIDLVSCIPVQHISMALEDSGGGSGGAGGGGGGGDASVTADGQGASELKALKALRLVRMSKMLRLAKIKRILAKYQDQVDLMQYMEMYVLIAVICLLAHLLACFFYLVGDADDECFFESDYIPCSYDASKPDVPGILRGWVFIEFGPGASERVDIDVRYWASLYYVFNALEPHILTTGERGFAVLAELVMAIIYGSIAGVMSTIMLGMKGNEKEMTAKMGGLRRWVASKKMPKPMQKAIMSYFNELWTQRAGLNTADMLEEMPPQLRLEATTIFYRENLASIPLFKGLAEEILFKLCRECRPLLILKGQTIVKEGTPGREMYVVMDGEVQVSVGGVDGSPAGPVSQDLGYLSAGAFFGESPVMSLLEGLDKYMATQDKRHLVSSTKDTVRSRTVTAVTPCELCYLTRDAVMQLAIDYPELRARLLRFTRPLRQKKRVPLEESLTKDEIAKLAMMKVRVKKAANHGRELRRASVTQEQAAAVAAAVAAANSGVEAWSAAMQDKIEQSSRDVEEELRRRSDTHAAEIEQKMMQAAELHKQIHMAG